MNVMEIEVHFDLKRNQECTILCCLLLLDKAAQKVFVFVY